MSPFYLTAALALTLATLPAFPAQAHHSFAMFDQTKTRTLKGTVQEYRWVNPHVALFVLVDNPGGGAPQLWSVELTSPGNLTRLGLSRKTFRVGDRIQVEVNPLRDGKPGGGFRQATLLDTGQVVQARLIDLEKKGS